MNVYRGFYILRNDMGPNGVTWMAEAGDGIIKLGPFSSEAKAKDAVDRELDDDECYSGGVL